MRPLLLSSTRAVGVVVEVEEAEETGARVVE